MSSLADELAADLDFSDDQAGNSDEEQQEQEDQYVDAMETQDTNDKDQANPSSSSLTLEQGHADSIYKVCHFFQNEQTKKTLERIDYFKSQDNNTQLPSKAPTEDQEEYQLIVNANGMTADIDGEIQAVHKFIRDHYASRFPELESLILNPLDYARSVKAIGNTKDISTADLKSILPSATIMVISVTATTTSGKPLTEAEWKITEEACDMALELDAAKRKIIEYVESRMAMVAPNLSNVVGSSTAAKLLTAAGGLAAFCKIPSSNVQVLGNNKKANTGFSSASMERHTGYIYSSELVYSVPADLRRKVIRIVAAKCALAARVDMSNTSPQGAVGQKLRDEIDQKIEKLQEPPPSKTTKALPIPDEGPKKRRGGKRVRRQKEAYAMTELRAARNRMAFGEAEDEVEYGDETEGLGMAAKQVGKIRASIADKRNKVKLSKKYQQKSYGSSGMTSGLASSLAFTPVQGIELIDPQAQAERAKKANEKYFCDGAFSIVKK